MELQRANLVLDLIPVLHYFRALSATDASSHIILDSLMTSLLKIEQCYADYESLAIVHWIKNRLLDHVVYQSSDSAAVLVSNDLQRKALIPLKKEVSI
jgi:hypothetical protein